jgi:hypothetical protein
MRSSLHIMIYGEVDPAPATLHITESRHTSLIIARLQVFEVSVAYHSLYNIALYHFM